MQMFSSYWSEKAAYDANQKASDPIVHVDPANSPMFNYSILYRKIEDRDEMNDMELRFFIQKNFTSILNNIFNVNVSQQYTTAFTDIRFLTAFRDVVSRMQIIDIDTMIRINLIVYHYIMLGNNNEEIINMMMSIGAMINRARSIPLKQFNLPEKLETCLLIARYSDFQLNICVKRVDLILTTSVKLMDKLDINSKFEASENAVNYLANLLVNLYTWDEWNFVLPYFMLDVLPIPNENDPATQWITPEVEAMSSALDLAMLQVLETMIESSARLRQILVSYAEGYRIMNRNVPVRFSFQCLSENYERIKKVIRFIQEEENIYVP